MTAIRAVIVTAKCGNGHTTEITAVSPVVQADGQWEGLLGSSADFCDVCDTSEMTLIAAEIREIDTDETMADVYRVKEQGS